jgi:dihydrodipicolinate synthase/N-acetylneuraminate lyase
MLNSLCGPVVASHALGFNLLAAADSGRTAFGWLNWTVVAVCLAQNLQWSSLEFKDGTASVTVLFIAFFFNSLVPYTSSQDVVQRYVTTRDLAAARRSLFLTMWISVFGSMVFFGMGTAIYAFYQTHPQALGQGLAAGDSILPFFIMQQLPVGVSGLVIAAIFAASQSTVSSSLNNVATVFSKDFDSRLLRPGRDDRTYLRVSSASSPAGCCRATGMPPFPCGAFRTPRKSNRNPLQPTPDPSMTPKLHGLVAATHTPFHSDGSLAPEVVPMQAAHLAKNGVGIAFITGSTGEAHSLTLDERLAMFAAWAAAGPANNLRVVAHVGSNCLEDAKAFTAAAADHGFEAVAGLAPSYFKPSRLEALVEWCAEIAAAAPRLPFYYYDIPSLTGVHFDMIDFLTAAAARIPNLAGIKFANDDLATFARCVQFDGGRFDIPWGIDEKLVDALGAGALGRSALPTTSPPRSIRNSRRRFNGAISTPRGHCSGSWSS